MGSLLLCRGERAQNPYYVAELGLHLYTGEELSYFIYHNRMLLGEDFLNEKLYRFIEDELKLPVLAGKLRKWEGQAAQSELLLVILQDIHYYNSTELFAFKEEQARLSRIGPAERLREKADYLLRLRRYYAAIRLYDQVLASKSDELISEGFRGRVWLKKGAALAGLFSFDEASRCYQKAYELLGSEELLRKIYELHLLDPLGEFPQALFDKVPSDLILRWKEEYEEKNRRLTETAEVQEAESLRERDSIRRSAGYQRLLQTWKNEYRRIQG